MLDTHHGTPHPRLNLQASWTETETILNLKPDGNVLVEAILWN